MVNAGKNYIGDVVNEDLEALVKAGQLVATANFADAAKCDCVCICVPTPLDAAPAAGHQLRPLLHGEHHAVRP